MKSIELKVTAFSQILKNVSLVAGVVQNDPVRDASVLKLRFANGSGVSIRKGEGTYGEYEIAEIKYNGKIGEWFDFDFVLNEDCYDRNPIIGWADLETVERVISRAANR